MDVKLAIDHKERPRVVVNTGNADHYMEVADAERLIIRLTCIIQAAKEVELSQRLAAKEKPAP